jgi:hypothetical protein
MRIRWAALLLSLMPLAAPAQGAQDAAETLPKLIAHADAVYPAIAKTAHVMGDVVVTITTDGESVVESKAESGPPLLLKAAEDNAKTWKFAPHSPGTFHLRYRFKFMDGDIATSFPRSDAVVEVAAAPPTLTITYGGMGLGTWKAVFSSSHGKFSETFEFVATGRAGEWLDFHVVGAPEEQGKDEDPYGDVNGDFLTFTTKLTEPGGQRLKTCLAGKITRDKIIGTFVDESGVRGTWTATRIPDAEKK